MRANVPAFGEIPARMSQIGGETAMRSYVASAILSGAMVLAPVVAGYAPAVSKSPFTITNDDPVPPTVVDTMLQRICSGRMFPIWWSHLPNFSVEAVFYQNPDGTKWVRLNTRGRRNTLPVTELGVSAQWVDYPLRAGQMTWTTHFAVWPDGDNHLSGTTVEPWGTLDLTCETEPSQHLGQ